MSGPRILLLVLLAAGVMLWAALSDNPEADRNRGLAESQLAFDSLETELLALEPPYQALIRRGLMLDLKAEHDEIRKQLALLRARRLQLGDDRTLARHELLPSFRKLVEGADEWLAVTRALRRRVQARHDFIMESSPLLRDGRMLRDQLLQRPVSDAGLRKRIEANAGWFAELESHAKRTDGLLGQNPEQGAVMAQSTLNALREYMLEAGRLVQEAGG